jgi:Amt family ammonium transporter
MGLTIAAVMLGALVVFTGSVAMAQDTAPPAVAGSVAPVLKIDTGDTAWVLTSTALVLAMTMPGLALFYGGLVRSKNILGTIIQSVVILCLVSLLWILVGYSLAFGPDKGGLIGGLEWVGLNGVGSEPHPIYGPTIPHQVFMLFQLMFAAITPALITGAFAERMRFSALLLFAALFRAPNTARN